MRHSFKIVQDKLQVASGEAPTPLAAMREAFHYAMQYQKDGPVEVTVRPVKAQVQRERSGSEAKSE